MDTQPDDAGSKLITADETPKSRRAFSGLKRELSAEELGSPGAHKLLLDHLERLEEEIAVLRPFRDRFYEADKLNGVLEEKLKANKAIEAVSTGTIAVGAAALVYAPVAWENHEYLTCVFAAIFGAILNLIGILVKR